MLVTGIPPSWFSGRGLSSAADTRPRRLRGPSRRRVQEVPRQESEARYSAAYWELLAEQAGGELARVDGMGRLLRVGWEIQ